MLLVSEILALAFFAFSGTGPFLFTDVTRPARLQAFCNVQGSASKDFILETTGGGAAFFDYNNDGWLDILLVRGSTQENYKRSGGDPVCSLFRNNRDGTFADVTQASRLTGVGWGQGVVAADYDNDGWKDVYITAYGKNFLFRNNGDGTFTDVTRRSGTGDPRWSIGAAFGDFDRDGFLDLYVANYLDFDVHAPPFRSSACTYKGVEVFCGPRGLKGARDGLYRNNGDGTFSDVSEKLGIDQESLYGMGVMFSDYDNDGDPDIFVANDLTRNLLYSNNGNGTFDEVAVLAGVAYDEDGVEEGSMGVDFGDYNRDGWLDLFYTNASYQGNALLQNTGSGFFQNLSYISKQGQASWLYVGWGTALADLDNDSWLDLFVVNGHLYPEADRFDMGISYNQRFLPFQNNGRGDFVEVGATAGEVVNVPRNSRGAAFGDYDNDGDLDVVVNNLDGGPTLLRNDLKNGKHWLLVKLAAVQSNRDGVGTRIKIEAESGTQVREITAGSSYASCNDIRAHFGLGEASLIRRLEVRWPTGKVQVLEDIGADQILTITEEDEAPAR